MNSLSADTSDTAEAVHIALLRQVPAWRKLRMTLNLSQSLKDLLQADLKERFPGDSETTRKQRLAQRWLGPELARMVYGDPDA